jgi:hypothetical protein
MFRVPVAVGAGEEAQRAAHHLLSSSFFFRLFLFDFSKPNSFSETCLRKEPCAPF